MLAAAVPLLFLHATYQPTLSIGIATTSVDVALADAAIAAVLVAAFRRARRDGWAPLRQARLLLVLAAAFLLCATLSLATPSLLGEDYAFATHAISVAKFAWYAIALPRDGPARPLVARSPAGRPCVRRLERRRDGLGPAAVPRRRVGVRRKASGAA